MYVKSHLLKVPKKLKLCLCGFEMKAIKENKSQKVMEMWCE